MTSTTSPRECFHRWDLTLKCEQCGTRGQIGDGAREDTAPFCLSLFDQAVFCAGCFDLDRCSYDVTVVRP